MHTGVDYSHQDFIIYGDNRFSSVPLALTLKKFGFFYVGTLRTNRNFVPKEIMKPARPRVYQAKDPADPANIEAEQLAAKIAASQPKPKNLTRGMKQGQYLMRFSNDDLSVTTWKGKTT